MPKNSFVQQNRKTSTLLRRRSLMLDTNSTSSALNSLKTLEQYSFKPAFFYCLNLAMDMPSELTALNITPRGALLRWNPPLSMVDNYVLTLTHNQGKRIKTRCGELDILSGESTPVFFTSNTQKKFKDHHQLICCRIPTSCLQRECMKFFYNITCSLL